MQKVRFRKKDEQKVHFREKKPASKCRLRTKDDKNCRFFKLTRHEGHRQVTIERVKLIGGANVRKRSKTRPTDLLGHSRIVVVTNDHYYSCQCHAFYDIKLKKNPERLHANSRVAWDIRKRDYHHLPDRRTDAGQCDPYVRLRRPHITATNK